MEHEVKVGQVEGLSGLAPVELLGQLEVYQVLVVGPDLKLVLGTSRKCHHSSKTWMMTIISLSWIS